MNLPGKYQNYRARLKSDFIRIGPGQGHSLPADTRENLSIHFGDATVFLGWYTGILATEHVLLSNGVFDPAVLNPSDTLRDLYFALKALERLMKKAPEAFESAPPQQGAEEEGFFIRDDVAEELKHEFGVERIASDFIAEDRFQKEESQDQLIHLLLGLALVKRFIPESVSIQGTSLVELSRQLAAKICAWPAAKRWIIRNPYWEYKRVARGSRALYFSFPIVAALQYIQGNESELLATVRGRYEFLWRHLLKYNLPCIYNPTNCHLALTLACIGNSWGENSLRHILNLSRRYEWPVYPMLNIVLHHNLAQLSSAPRISRYVAGLIAASEAMLREAPYEGPSYEGSPRGWKASHRFLAGTYAQNYGYDHHRRKRFSGVDFMLLHNLYQIIESP